MAETNFNTIKPVTNLSTVVDRTKRDKKRKKNEDKHKKKERQKDNTEGQQSGEDEEGHLIDFKA